MQILCGADLIQNLWILIYMKLAVKEGVEVRFNEQNGTKKEFDAARESSDKTIITTGFGQSAYEDLGMRFTPFYGYWTRTGMSGRRSPYFHI